jgi:hypothetical protein
VSRFRAKPSNLPAFVNEISRREMARTAVGIAAAIEHHLDAANALIAALDAMEGDCDLEETRPGLFVCGEPHARLCISSPLIAYPNSRCPPPIKMQICLLAVN